jgi:hypothetical protein
MLRFPESTCSAAYQVSDGFFISSDLGQQVPQHDVHPPFVFIAQLIYFSPISSTPQSIYLSQRPYSSCGPAGERPPTLLLRFSQIKIGSQFLYIRLSTKCAPKVYINRVICRESFGNGQPIFATSPTGKN